MSSESSRAVRVVVDGMVQGVGFRDGTVEEAGRLGVTGWVRNGDDGEVRAHAEGPTAAVEEFIAFLRRGPRGARVETAEVEDVGVEGHEQFAIRGVSSGRFVVEEQGGRVAWPEGNLSRK